MGIFTFTDKKGYSRVKGLNIPVHRIAASVKLGRALRKGEVVHHKNRNKQDNSFGNVHVCKNQNEHDKFHKLDAKRHGKKVSYKGF